MSQIAINPTPPPDDRPHKPADDTEEVYFEGSPLLRSELGTVIIWWLIALVVLAIPVLRIVYHWAWPWWVSAALVAAAVVLVFVPVRLRTAIRYRITNYRIDVSYGVLSRNVDTVELWHVEDLRLHQSLLNRMADVGTISITSHDQSLPKLALRGLPKPQELFRMLEQRVIAVKRQRGVMKVDPG
jgi:membrane protein YdbS with pleckstrin-like domain